MKRREHIANLRNAIARGERRLNELRYEAISRGVCPCCVGASYGGTHGPYDRLVRRQERRMNLLKSYESSTRR